MAWGGCGDGAAASGGGVLAGNAAGASSGVPDGLARVVGSHHDAFTDSEGRFVMRGLSAGTVELEIVGWSLPDKMRVQGESVRAVVLTPGDAVLVDPFVLEGVAAGAPVKTFKFN